MLILDVAGVKDQGQISKMMMTRLQAQGLIENTRGQDTKGIAKAWRLTPHGQAVLDAHRPGSSATKDPTAVRGGKLVPKKHGTAQTTPLTPQGEALVHANRTPGERAA
jgi:DNA-binding MarR family transcriptional regulator